MRRIIITLSLAVVAAVGLGGIGAATGGGSPITQARLEHSLTTSFSNVYSQQAALVGHQGVSPRSMGAKAMCDKGPGLTQSGPGASWICLMSWQDPNVPMSSAGYGKFELTVHSNGCFTAGSPSSLVGYQTISDAAGRTVNNPAYEFDGCLDPDSDNTPTGVTFPSALTITTTSVAPDPHGKIRVALACAAGAGGCVGTVTATAGSTVLGTVPFQMTEQATRSLPFDTPLPGRADNVTFAVQTTAGVAPSPSTVPVQR